MYSLVKVGQRAGLPGGVLTFPRPSGQPAQQGSLRQFKTDASGQITVIFGLMLPVLLLSTAFAIDLGRTMRYRSEVQSAADSAALAATTAVMANASANATQIATTYFQQNAPAGATTSGTVTVTPSNYNNTVTTTVQYSGTAGSAFNDKLGIVNVTSTATSAQPKTQYSGYGNVWGDPHVDGADNVNFYLACAKPSGSWYNLLSDAGLQVNVSCVHDTIWNYDAMQTFSVVLRDPALVNHVVTISAPPPTEAASTANTQNDSLAVYDAKTAWFGQITIDGVSYPATMGTHSYLNGAVVVHTTDLTNFYQSDNYVVITTPTYTLNISFMVLAEGTIYVTATNAGLCGAPGGFLGQTFSGVNDSNGADFLVSGPTAQSTQFLWSTCTTDTQKTAHLIK